MMGPGEWIAAAVAAGGFIAWMGAMWVRAGRILQRVDDVASDQVEIKKTASSDGKRISRLEGLIEAWIH